MNRYYSVLFCTVAIIAVVSATDYCSTEICKNGDHIACHHSGQFDSNCPPGAEIVPINNTLRSILVKAHNKFRNIIAGGGDKNHKPACRMATMKWDKNLAAHADLNVMQCKMAHDRCRNTVVFKNAGQNLAYVSFNGEPNHAKILNKLVKGWYDEVKDSTQAYIDSFPENYSGPVITHFTGMMLEHNIRLGCGIIIYPVKGETYKIYLLACNYASKTMVGSPIYVKCPKAATGCKTGANPRFKNLCSIREKYAVK